MPSRPAGWAGLASPPRRVPRLLGLLRELCPPPALVVGLALQRSTEVLIANACKRVGRSSCGLALTACSDAFLDLRKAPFVLIRFALPRVHREQSLGIRMHLDFPQRSLALRERVLSQ